MGDTSSAAISSSSGPDGEEAADVAVFDATIETPPPEGGQLWSLRWNEVVALAVVVWSEGSVVLVFPATRNTSAQEVDEQAVLIPDGDDDSADQLAIWYGLETGIGGFLLESWLGDVLSSDDCTALHNAFVTGVLPSGFEGRLGRSADHQFGDGLAGTFGQLSGVEWLDILTVGIQPVVTEERGELASLKPSQLAKLLGVSNGVAVSILRGDVPLSLEQRYVLGQHVNLPNSVGIASERTRSLVRSLNSPRLKKMLNTASRRLQIDEGLLRATTLMRLSPTAARSQGEGDDRYWDPVVRDYLKNLVFGAR